MRIFLSILSCTCCAAAVCALLWLVSAPYGTGEHGGHGEAHAEATHGETAHGEENEHGEMHAEETHEEVMHDNLEEIEHANEEFAQENVHIEALGEENEDNAEGVILVV